MSQRASGLFLPSCAGEIFVVYRAPQAGVGPPKSLVFVPPFAEEMNKSRRMFTLQAERAAELGFASLIVDLYGTGDSKGDFVEARWNIWERDLDAALTWLRERGIESLTLLGLRTGALLALRAIQRRDDVERLLLWQPVVSGQGFLTQFLRLRLAASMLDKERERESTTAMRKALERGETIEIAGYDLSPELARAVDALRIADLVTPQTPPIDWLEVARTESAGLTPVSQRVITRWIESGLEVSASAVTGEPFWTTPEISIAPPLLEQTTAVLQTIAPS